MADGKKPTKDFTQQKAPLDSGKKIPVEMKSSVEGSFRTDMAAASPALSHHIAPTAHTPASGGLTPMSDGMGSLSSSGPIQCKKAPGAESRKKDLAALREMDEIKAQRVSMAANMDEYADMSFGAIGGDDKTASEALAETDWGSGFSYDNKAGETITPNLSGLFDSFSALTTGSTNKYLMPAINQMSALAPEARTNDAKMNFLRSIGNAGVSGALTTGGLTSKADYGLLPNEDNSLRTMSSNRYQTGYIRDQDESRINDMAMIESQFNMMGHDTLGFSSNAYQGSTATQSQMNALTELQRDSKSYTKFGTDLSSMGWMDRRRHAGYYKKLQAYNEMTAGGTKDFRRS